MSADARPDVQVIWLPRTSSRPGGAGGGGRGPVAALRAYGNAWADAKAKLARALHPAPPLETVSLARVSAFTQHLVIHYARMLDWATSGPGRLPDISPLERIFKLPRPPPIPEHCFAEDASGEARCIHCLLPPSLAKGRPCRRHGTLRHKVFRLGSGIFCGRCGAHSFEQVVLLSSGCHGRPTSAGSDLASEADAGR